VLKYKVYMGHIINNFSKLATSNLRKHALEVIEAGFNSINTEQVIQKHLVYMQSKNVLVACGKKFDLSIYKRIVCVGFGKAAFSAVSEIQKILKDRISCGFVIDLKDGDLGNIVCKIGTHPYPTKINVQATKQLVEMLKECSEEDLVICVVSGGGSALLCDPNEMTCELESEIIAGLTVEGANILELNTVRKHISKVKGGQLAKIIYPATCISLIFSDVPGDDLGVIASGPTVKDSTTISDAVLVLKKYNILEKLNIQNFKLIETPKESKYYEKIYNYLVVSPKQTLLSMKEKALELGFEVKIFDEKYQGEARKLGPEIVLKSKPGQCLLGAGESTVKIVGKGLGGRNEEMVLSALPFLKPGQVFASLASDGHDNNDSAGAMADYSNLQKAKALGFEVDEYLANNDSYNYFSAVEGLVFTGQTGSNVSDFFVFITES
jgi:glycerate 2-kinase